MKKGFTLIELLAVIVILAIILLIAMPIVLNVISQARKGAFEATARGLIKAAENQYMKNNLVGNPDAKLYVFVNFEQTEENLDFSGRAPRNGYIYVDEDGQTAIVIEDGDWLVTKNLEEKDIKTEKYENQDLDEVFSEMLNIYVVTYLADENGFIEGISSQPILKGNDTTFVTAMPNSGYVFVIWDDGYTEPNRQDFNIQNAMNVTALFDLIANVNYQVSVVASPSEGGTVSLSGGVNGEFDYEELAIVTASANTGYQFVGWSDLYNNSISNDLIYEFNVTSNQVLVAEFALTNIPEATTPTDPNYQLGDPLLPLNPSDPNYPLYPGIADPCNGETTITIADQEYAIVGIGNQCWMVENLNYNGHSAGVSWCYENNSSMCEQYGRLYNFAAANSACPTGTYLPSDLDYQVLEMSLGMSYNEASGLRWRNSGGVGEKLKAISFNGNNNVGLNILPGGWRYNYEYYAPTASMYHWWENGSTSLKPEAKFWTASGAGDYGWYRGFNQEENGVHRWSYNKGDGYSVRCLVEPENEFVSKWNIANGVELYNLVGEIIVPNAEEENDIIANSGIMVFQETGSYSLKIPNYFPQGKISVLIVAGGGSGGTHMRGGGGGAGGLIFVEEYNVAPNDEINVVVGAGGIGTSSGPQNNGGNSSFSDLSAIGGGAGGLGEPDTYNRSGRDGGSGGGANGSYSGTKTGGLALQPALGGFGTNGGQVVSMVAGGGGGGANQAGQNGPSANGGYGGSGRYYGDTFGNFVGDAGWFAGGGGGGRRNTGIGGVGGTGGGGAGGTTSGTAQSGMKNTGGGGGGNGDGGLSGNGGSGVVIIKWQEL